MSCAAGMAGLSICNVTGSCECDAQGLWVLLEASINDSQMPFHQPSRDNYERSQNVSNIALSASLQRSTVESLIPRFRQETSFSPCSHSPSKMKNMNESVMYLRREPIRQPSSSYIPCLQLSARVGTKLHPFPSQRRQFPILSTSYQIHPLERSSCSLHPMNTPHFCISFRLARLLPSSSSLPSPCAACCSDAS